MSRPKKKKNGPEERSHFLGDKLLWALFINHRNLLPRELESRLLPMVVAQPNSIVRIERRKLPSVICLPDRSWEPPITAPRPTHRRVGARIVREVCAKYDVELWRFMGGERTGDVLAVRREVCFRMAKETALSYPAIGRLIRRDHTTVMHCIVRYCELNRVPHPREAKHETGDRRESVSWKPVPAMA